ncbi:MAG: phosphopantothenoylcysteine decarboxylase [Candidatus Omnitrophica bacterium]|nr:phosphopantothenoylcysteine decarboxylase [Candidatus Omnitrophota bacterium]
MSKPKEVILGVTGSIAAYKACELINRLKRRRINVSVVMTKEAEEFITPLTLQALSANKVIRSLFALTENVSPAHISLAQRAGLVLIAPATANIVAKLAAGLADDVLSALVLSTRAPVVLCCAMNEEMFKHKITQQNIARLKKIGYRFIGPRKGRLVCGGEGMGHLAKVEEIVEQVVAALK